MTPTRLLGKRIDLPQVSNLTLSASVASRIHSGFQDTDQMCRNRRFSFCLETIPYHFISIPFCNLFLSLYSGETWYNSSSFNRKYSKTISQLVLAKFPHRKYSKTANPTVLTANHQYPENIQRLFNPQALFQPQPASSSNQQQPAATSSN